MPSEAPDRAPHREMGLSDLEYDAIVNELGREPTHTELGMFAVLWSEHCSYKSSKPVLKFFSDYKKSVEGDGLENAGVIDIGDGIGITFKVESHNHPSAVEPYEGAATGVGGIIRDILTMGARPIASLNSLRFGDISVSSEDRRLFARVVEGIGGYGNCIGVPTVAGEVSFHSRYAGNPLVNAMCVGQLSLDKITSAAARGPGNSVVYLGSATGLDGIHGATFASDVLSEDTEDKRPNVQIGDPFAGKLLIEATLEALATGAIVAIQDMGAAGLTCSTCEMSSKGNVGMEIELDKVPLRSQEMGAYEIMLSESQERMLAVVEIDREREVLDVFRKWGLPASVIGRVTPEPTVVIKHHGRVEATVPAHYICDGCPTLDLEASEPENVQQAKLFDPKSISQPHDYEKCLVSLLSAPNIASKRWVYEQYDSTVQTQTSIGPGLSGAAVLALRGTKKGIATKIDCNAHYVYADPYVGGQLALIEAARNVACTGARPMAATDCLNFGNPNDPKVYFQFRESVRGLADASEALEIPVISGNVSFYNETDAGEVLPTPTVGVVGVIEDVEKRIGMGFPKGMGYIYMVYGYSPAPRQQGLGASEYARVVHGEEGGAPESPDLTTEKALIQFLSRATDEQLISCAHDVSDGGFAVALAEMSIAGEAGCYALVDADEHFQRHILGPVLDHMLTSGISPSESVQRALIDAETGMNPWLFTQRMDARLFGELPGRVLFGVSNDAMRHAVMDRIWSIAEELHLALHCIGTYDYTNLKVQMLSPSRVLLEKSVQDLRSAYESAIPTLMSKQR